jgi:hypothetical protein
MVQQSRRHLQCLNWRNLQGVPENVRGHHVTVVAIVTAFRLSTDIAAEAGEFRWRKDNAAKRDFFVQQPLFF